MKRILLPIMAMVVVALPGVAKIPASLAQSAPGSWDTLAPMPTARDGVGVAAGSDGRIYAIGGVQRPGNTVLNTVEAYDPVTNSWSEAAPLPTARAYLTAVTGSDGRIYALGGHDNEGMDFATVEAYSPATNTWTTVAP